jgi:hypothetical protein
MKNKTPNLRRALIFNSQKCDIQVGIKWEIMKYELTDIQQKAAVDFLSIANCQTKITRLFLGIFGNLFKTSCSYIQ